MSEWGTMMPVNVQVEQKWTTPPDFPASFSMTQQGFTAEVTCRQQELDASTVPSLTLFSHNQTLFNSTITLARLETLCPNSTESDFSGGLFKSPLKVTVSSMQILEPVLTSANADAFFGASCDANETSGRRYWSTAPVFSHSVCLRTAPFIF
jgi:hypothetical protein